MEEAEAVTHQMLLEGDSVVGALEGEIIRILQTIPDQEVMVISAVHDRKMLSKACLDMQFKGLYN